MSSQDIGKKPVTLASRQAVHELGKVRCSVEGHGALTQRTPVSIWPQTGLRSLVQPLWVRDSGVQALNARRPPPAGGVSGAVAPGVGAFGLGSSRGLSSALGASVPVVAGSGTVAVGVGDSEELPCWDCELHATPTRDAATRARNAGVFMAALLTFFRDRSKQAPLLRVCLPSVTRLLRILPRMSSPRTAAQAFVSRRRALAARLEGPALIAAGLPLSRNYRANIYPFRAKSHFLYLVGASLPGAALLLADGRATLFVVPEAEGDALWHGPQPAMGELRDRLAVDAVRPLDELDDALRELRAQVATLPTEDAKSAAWLSERLGRGVRFSSGDRLGEDTDIALAEAMIAQRLTHDEAAIVQLRAAAEVSARAHIAGMRATHPGSTEAEVVGAMIGSLRREGLEDAYGPIVTVHGEILHNERHDGAIEEGDLLLADVGGETPEGWAADITRVWPVSGTFSATQRAIYDVVLAAQRAAIARVRKGVRYREVHETAKRVLVEGLVALGIFRGEVDGLLERGAAAIFFPHGVGHLLGLDVHDMEDLGDRAGYAPGRTRSKEFGDCYLRLDRDLSPGMAVTIEPGFYQVPAILRDERYVGRVGDDLRRDVLARYADVRGIRIEDDVLCTEGDPEVLTRSVPKEASEVEVMMRG